jgi:hypothetical protein
MTNVLNRMLKWWKRTTTRTTTRQPEAWAVKYHGYRAFNKVVQYGKPNSEYGTNVVVGPFRSEVDCEEFCDRQNSVYIKLYHRKDVT